VQARQEAAEYRKLLKVWKTFVSDDEERGLVKAKRVRIVEPRIA